MKIVPAQCPNCGATIKVDEELRKGLCQFCETVFLIEDAIQQFQGKVEIDYAKKIENYLIRALDFYDDKQFSEAEKYCNMVLDLDASNSDAKTLLKKLKQNITKPNVIISCIDPSSSSPKSDCVYVNGEKKLQTINPYGSLTLPVGRWTIEIQAGFTRSKPVEITINSNKDEYEVKYRVKFFKTTVEVNKIK